MHYDLVISSVLALLVYGAIIAGALQARSWLRILGVSTGLVGLALLAVYVPVAWQTRAFLRGYAETFPGMPAYHWSTLAMLCALSLAALAACALHRAEVDPRWWRTRR